MATKAIPDGMDHPIPYLFVRNAAAALDWYAANLGGTERLRMTMPDGETVMHGEVAINGRTVMVSEANEDFGTRAPDPAVPAAFKVMVYFDDVDAVSARCREAGAVVVREPEDQFWGDRLAEIRDPFGHAWYLATAKEALTPAEIEARAEAAFGTPS